MIIENYTQKSARYRLCLRQNFFGSNYTIGHQAMATSKLWRFVLITLGAVSTLVYPHPPLVSFASIAGTTLYRPQAIVVATLIWLINQFYGYTLRQYPLTLESLLWGVLMGLATLAVALVASVQPKFTQNPWLNQLGWLAIAFPLGFGIYQSSIFFVSTWMGMHGLTLDIFLRICLRDTFWVIALFALHCGLVFTHPKVRWS